VSRRGVVLGDILSQGHLVGGFGCRQVLRSRGVINARCYRRGSLRVAIGRKKQSEKARQEHLDSLSRRGSRRRDGWVRERARVISRAIVVVFDDY
jgi:hypothetical protein